VVLGWLPEIPLNSQAIQLGGMFAVALHVTDGVTASAQHRPRGGQPRRVSGGSRVPGALAPHHGAAAGVVHRTEA